MKILLFGDYSGLHRNLADGLNILGHDAKVASSGDGWKKIDREINLPILGGNGLLDKIKYRFEYYNFIREINNYEIVQLINPRNVSPFSLWFSYRVFNMLLRNNEKIFLSAAGGDGYFWKYGADTLIDNYREMVLKDKGTKTYKWGEDKYFLFNKYVANKSNGVIPVMYEYEIGYRGHSNLCKTIPLPINTERVSYSPNVFSGKLVVFHGINRYWTKGTDFVEKAFEILRKKYPNDLELIINSRMPVNEYLNVMKKTNIVIDQTYGGSCGMNALFALAMGKVVMGGAEPECLQALGITKTPVINILPDVDDIVKKVEWILEKKNKIEEMGLTGRKLIEETHDYVKVAQQYVDVWNQS